MLKFKELDLFPNSVARTLLYDKKQAYIISTINLKNMKEIDSLLGTMQKVFDDTERFDLNTPGEYETMVFQADPKTLEVDDWAELDAQRYQTEENALEGHKEIVTKWQEKHSA